ncbi:ChaN family lipoprotein [Undibacterium umbellatum]|uniref:ChaN family lipoprotein n=1 Tax=Undibacterium umbellatum TaxID=2762300 RepID=A0ABR6ZGM4_9BURK|nr:ChaN family lipoprotein [Undibacterium umbellatum]MBC3910881.1 ChaN family lipoprotein [Undibacterium umbellatum]
MRKISLLTGLVTASLLSACATQAEKPVSGSKILLLGEVHDNPDGHAHRYADLQKMLVAGWRPAIAMEQFDRENQAELTQAQAACTDADCIISKLGNKRWEWPHYRPVIQLAIDYKLPLLAANLSRSDAARVMREGYAAVLDKNTISSYKLDQALPTVVVNGQRAAMESGHCGKMPDNIVPSMVRAQVARDVWMAKVVTDNADRGVVLLAGNGHVRRDLGVPVWLPANRQASLQIHGYVEDTNSNKPGDTSLYDVSHVVKAHARPDPCLSIPAPKNPT